MILQVLESHRHRVECDLALVVARRLLAECFLPRFVPGFQLPREHFHCRKQLPLLPQLVVHLWSLLQEFENDGLVLHAGLHWCQGVIGLEAQCYRLGRGREWAGASRGASVPCAGTVICMWFPARGLVAGPATPRVFLAVGRRNCSAFSSGPA